jgi:DNA-binding LytR/AlgR family response regulator
VCSQFSGHLVGWKGGFGHLGQAMNTLKTWPTTHEISFPECVSDSMDDHEAQRSPAASGTARVAEQRARPTKAFSRLHSRAESQSLRVAIKVRGRIVFIRLSDITSVQAEGKCVWLQLNTGSYLLRESISGVAEKLETHGFIRIHRSVIVNTSFVEEIRPLSTGEYSLRLEGGKEYTVTRTYKKNLKSLAEMWVGTGPFVSS